MESKVLKKILVMAIVFVMTFSNCGLTLQALATSEGISFFGFKLFAKNNLDYEAYFLDANGKKIREMTSDINQEMTLVLDLEPKEVGYLKTGTIKAVTDEGEPNLEFLEILNVSIAGNEEEENENQLVQADKPLIQAEQVLNTELPTVSLDNTLLEIDTANSSKTDTTEVSADFSNSNIVDVDNTISDDVTADNDNTVPAENVVETDDIVVTEQTASEPILPTIEEEEKAPELSVVTPPPVFETEDTMVDEDNAYQEQVKEREDAEMLVSSASSAKIINGNEILVENITHPSKIYIKIGYKASENLKPYDLYKTVNLDLEGTYINEDLEEVVITATDSVNTEWTYTSNIMLASDISKISAFEIEGTKGTLVEGKITLRRECLEENYLPIKETTLEIEVPQINGKSPIALDVNATKLKATKGQEINEVTFSQDNWSYNESTNTITIKVINPEAVLTAGDDIYTIVFRYEDYVESEELTVNLNGKAIVEEYSGKSNNKIVKDFSTNKTTIVNIGELITYSIGTTEETISKGLINANYNSVEAVYEAEFTSTVGINILTNDVLEEFTLKNTREYYITKDNVELEAQDIKYKTIKFRYNEIMTLLDEGGIIEIRANTGEVLYTLSKDNTNSQADCEVALNGDVHGVEVSFKNIVANGTFTIDFIKSLGKCSYDKSAFNNFEKIESRIKAEVKYGTSEAVIPLTPIKTEKYFEKSYTRAEISMNKEELSTTVDNDNVEIKIELNNNTEKSDLYINPEFEVVFPQYVQNVEVKSINLLYEDGLVVKNITLFKDEANIQRMKIQLEGVQRSFVINEITNGTNIIINTKIIVDNYTPRKDDQLKMYYFNQGVSNYQSQTDWKISTPIPEGIIKTTNGFDSYVFKFNAPTGLITVNEIENYDGQGSKIYSLKQGIETTEIARESIAKVAKMNLIAINNTENQCTDVVFLGRIPFKGATDIKTGEVLETNIDTKLFGSIIENEENPLSSKIYYSENPNADKNLEDSTNGWIENPESLENIKSFLIIPSNTLEPGYKFKYTYEFIIPENLPYGAKIYGSFGAFYNNHSDVAVVYETSQADLVGLMTELGMQLDLNLTVDIGDGAKIGEARFLKYTLTVANPGSVEVKNITIEAPVPEYTTLYTYTSKNGYGNDNYQASSEKGFLLDLESLAPKEVETYSYMVKTNEIPSIKEYYSALLLDKHIEQDEKGCFYEVENESGEKEKKYLDSNYEVYIKNKVKLKANNMAGTIESNETSNLLIKSNFSMTTNTEAKSPLKLGSKCAFLNSFTNISGKTLKNVVYKCDLPETVEYLETDVQRFERSEEFNKNNISYDSKTHTVYVTFDEINDNETINAYIDVKIISGKKDEVITYYSLITEDGKEEKSYELSRIYAGGILEVSQTTNLINEKVLEDEKIEFVFKIKNTGNYVAEDVFFIDEISKNLENVTVDITGSVSDNFEVLDNNLSHKIGSIPAEGIVMVTISGTATRLNGSEKNISSQCTIYAKDIKESKSNLININIEENPDKKDNSIYEPDTPKNPNINEEPNSSPSNNTSDDNVNQSGGDNSNLPDTNNSNSNNDSQNSSAEIIQKSISGYVWLDENKNGRKEVEEKSISTVVVQLFNNDSMLKTTTTDGNGYYKFDNIENGKYIVNFIYEQDIYTVTEYKKENVEEELNSKAIKYEEGSAVTNVFTISDLSIENMNLGLQYKDTCDLVISKYLTKSVVDIDGKATSKKYENLNLAKLELNAKSIEKTNIELTYRIIITNNGNVPAKVLKVVDYIPKDMKFNETNKANANWYLGNDGNVYNESLKQLNINPGEDLELELVLSKKMTSENTGVLSNKVEILDTEIEASIKEDTSNNISTQETILTIRTGGNFVPITVIMTIIALGAYAIITERMIVKIENNKLKVKINTKKIYK